MRYPEALTSEIHSGCRQQLARLQRIGANPAPLLNILVCGRLPVQAFLSIEIAVIQVAGVRSTSG
jgi:hypothetical protein